MNRPDSKGWLGGWGLILLLLGGLSLATPVQGQTLAHTFPETGYTVRGAFWQYWQQHGGLAVQGYPISAEFTTRSDLDGRPYTVQYFERAVFEAHPENAPLYDVLLTQLGTLRYQQKYPQGAPGQRRSPDNSLYFAPTKHAVGGRFRRYWAAQGGLAQFGYPISEEFTERSDLDGQLYVVQYFERAVFEAHPENAPPYDVLLAQLGTGQYQAKGQPGTCGLSWRTTIIPEAATTRLSTGLQHLTALSSTDIWAVGSQERSGSPQGLILHWDGRGWRQIALPPDAQAGILQFADVAASGPHDVWALGSGDSIEVQRRPHLVHWDGTTWRQTPLPDEQNDLNLYRIAAISPGDAWAVGERGIQGLTDLAAIALHWDGQTWREVPVPDVGRYPRLFSVSARATNDVWAVGTMGSGGVAPGIASVALHWNGTAWRQVLVPAGGAWLQDVATVTATDAWAVGSYPFSDPHQPWILHWDGRAWTPLAFPDLAAAPTDQIGFGLVVARAANKVWIAGYTGMPTLLHWDGQTWQRLPVPADIPPTDIFYGIAPLASGNIWALAAQGRILHYFDPCAPQSP